MSDQVWKAGQVKRCHTLMNSIPATVASHSWGVAMLILAHYRDAAGPRLLHAALTHDLGEYFVGDIPAPASWTMRDDVRQSIKKMEAEALVNLIDDNPMAYLTEYEDAILKWADMEEFRIHMQAEVDAGNFHCLDALRNAEQACKERRGVIRIIERGQTTRTG